MNVELILGLVGSGVAFLAGGWLIISKIMERRDHDSTRKLPSYEALDNAVSELRTALDNSDKAHAEEIRALRGELEKLAQARRDDKDAVRMLLYGIARDWPVEVPLPQLDVAALEQLGPYIVPLQWRPRPTAATQ